MRLLTLAQLRRRLAVLALLAAVFTVGVWLTELAVGAFSGLTPWTGFAVLLGGVAVFSLYRWAEAAEDEAQSEWQPALMLRVLGGGFGFQAGVIGYFVANDVVAAIAGCAMFLVVIAHGSVSVGGLAFDG